MCSSLASGRYLCTDKQGSLDSSVMMGTGLEKQDQVFVGSNNSGYVSDPTFTRRHPKAQPAHINCTLPRSHSNYKPFSHLVPTHMSSSGIYGEMGSRPIFVHNGPTYRSHFNQLSSTRPPYAPGMHQVNTTMNSNIIQSQSGLNQAGVTVTTVSSKLYPGGPSILTPAQPVRPPLVINGNENNSQTPQPSGIVSDSSVIRNPQLQTTSTHSSSTATFASASHTAVQGRSQCANCGWHGQMQVPVIQHLWANNIYPNGFVPLQQITPVYMTNTPFSLNGITQDINPTVIVMAHPATQGVASVPNLTYNNYGYNSYVPQGGGNSQRKQKKLNCHNCGSSKHSANDCTDGTMEAMSGELILL